MKENKYFLNTTLAVVVGITLAVCMVLRTFIPWGVLPKLDIPNMVLLSVIALVATHYLSGAAVLTPLSPILAALTFGLLPYAASFAGLLQACKLAVIGGIVFTLTAWLYSSVQERLSSGPVAKAAPVLSALGLWLAAQCFAGILL